MMMYHEKSGRLQGRILAVFSVLIFLAVGVAIYAYVRNWTDWMSFIFPVLAFFAFAIIAWITAYACLHDCLNNNGWEDDAIIVLVWLESLLVACLSAPIWYYHENTPGCIGFWSFLMPIVAFGCPLCINLLVLPLAIYTGKIDRRNKAKEVESVKEQWRPFLLGENAECFREQVEEFRQKFNLNFACSCCMRMVLPSAIRWFIADDHVKRTVAFNPRQAGAPRNSSAHLETNLYVSGEEVKIRFNLFASGKAALGWDWDKNEAVEEFVSWDSLIRSIDKRMGR